MLTQTARRLRIMIVAGTRPEAIKVAPLVLGLQADERFECLVVDSGQHPTATSAALGRFGITADARLKLDRISGSLPELGSRVLLTVEDVLNEHQPDAVVVQGDTATALMAGLTAHWHQIPVVHLEAGLRTGDMANPFPEEMHRKALASLAQLHLAPTALARAALLQEGVDPARIVVTGNTVVDALALQGIGLAEDGERVRGHVVVTVHRRESWGQGITSVLEGLTTALAHVPGAHATVITHPNPAVAEHVRARLAGIPDVRVLEPQPYDTLLAIMRTADVILTDSGGIQEEAPTIGVPVLVARETTERREAIDAGVAVLVGTDADRIVDHLTRLLTDESARAAMAPTSNPYGDGQAAGRCADAIAMLLGAGDRPEEFLG